MIDKIINNIVWWIPIKKLRNAVREYLNIVYKELIKILFRHIEPCTLYEYLLICY